MTPKDCLLTAICFLLASLLLKVAQPILFVPFFFISLVLWMVSLFIFPILLLGLSAAGAAIAVGLLYGNDESIACGLTAVAAGMLTMLVLLCGVRLLWPYIHAYYLFHPDDATINSAMISVTQFSIHFCVICAVILTLLAFMVELCQQPIFGVVPSRQAEEQEMHAIDQSSAAMQEANQPSTVEASSV